MKKLLLVFEVNNGSKAKHIFKYLSTMYLLPSPTGCVLCRVGNKTINSLSLHFVTPLARFFKELCGARMVQNCNKDVKFQIK